MMRAKGGRRLAFLAGVQGVGYVATLGWNIIGARVCSIHVYGVVSLAFGLILALQVLLEMGHQRALVRFLGPDMRTQEIDFGKQLRRRALIVPLGVGLVLGALVALMSILLPPTRWGGVWLTEWAVIVPAGVGAALINVQAGAYIAAGRAIASSMLSLTAMPVSLCVLFLMLSASGHNDAQHMLAAVSIPYILGGVFSLWSLWSAPSDRHQEMEGVGSAVTPSPRVFYSFAWSAFVIGLVSLGLGYADRYILGAMSSLAVVGLYNLPARTARLLNVPIYFLNPLAGPVYAAAYRSHDVRLAIDVFRASSRFIGMIVLPLGLTAIVFARQFLVMAGGAQFAEAGTTLSVLAVGVLVLTFSGNGGLLLQMAGKERAEVRCGLCGLVANVVLAVALVRPMGMLGVAIATALGLGVIGVGRFWICRASWGVSWSDMLRPRQLVGAAVVVLVGGGAERCGLAWQLAAAIGLLAFFSLNSPLAAFRDLERSLARADLILGPNVTEAGEHG